MGNFRSGGQWWDNSAKQMTKIVNQTNGNSKGLCGGSRANALTHPKAE